MPATSPAQLPDLPLIEDGRFVRCAACGQRLGRKSKAAVPEWLVGGPAWPVHPCCAWRPLRRYRMLRQLREYLGHR